MTRVFISYSHESSAHNKLVSGLARSIERALPEARVVLDQHLSSDPELRWPDWCKAQVRRADRVLCILTQTYRRRWDAEEEPGTGRGATYEAMLIKTDLYENPGANPKYRAVILNEEDKDHVPAELRGNSVFFAGHSADPFIGAGMDDDFAELLEWIVPPPPRGLETPRRAPQWPPHLPVSETASADRRDEIGALEALVTRQMTESILLVEGSSGLGKTRLLGELWALASEAGLHTAHLNFSGGRGLNEVLLELHQNLLGGSVPEPPPEELRQQVIGILRSRRSPVIIAIDDYHEASRECRWWIEYHLLPKIEDLPAVIVIAGQILPDASRFIWSRFAFTMQLGPIRAAEDWLEFARSRGTWEGHHDDLLLELVEAYRGHPGQIADTIRVLGAARPAPEHERSGSDRIDRPPAQHELAATVRQVEQGTSSDSLLCAVNSVEVILQGLPREVGQGLQAAALPHWVDAQILAVCLESTLEAADEVLERLAEESYLEASPGRRATWTVRPSLRTPLRYRLAQQRERQLQHWLGQILKLLQAIPNPSLAERLEVVYLKLCSDDDHARSELEALFQDLEADRRFELEGLGNWLGELAAERWLPPRAAATARLYYALVMRRRLPLLELAAITSDAIQLFRQHGETMGEREAQRQLARIRRSARLLGPSPPRRDAGGPVDLGGSFGSLREQLRELTSYEEHTDEEVVVAFQQGDRWAAFEELRRRFGIHTLRLFLAWEYPRREADRLNLLTWDRIWEELEDLVPGKLVSRLYLVAHSLHQP